MQLEKNESQLVEILNRAILELERIEDDPKSINFVARRVGNIVKHMKDLRDDLRPRGPSNGSNVRSAEEKAFSSVSLSR